MKTETLLAETGFLERLAASLTFGSEDPEDVVQQTWLAALNHPPREGAGLRSWLAVVLRNALRQSRRSRLRRTARERFTARPEAVSPAEDLRLREEIRARIVEAVLALDEPYRSAVLLRYFEELPPRRIAARLSVPVATVKSRIARGLRQLRARLDEEGGGDGRSWALALLPLAGARAGGGGALAAASAGKIAAVAVAAAVLVAVGVTLFDVADPVVPDTADPRTRGAFVREDLPAPPRDLDIRDGSGSYGGDPDDPFGRPSRGRVVDAAGRGVPGATILIATDPLCPGYSEQADKDGAFRVPGSSEKKSAWLCACLQGVGASPWVRCREAAEDVVLELAAGGVVEGRVAHPESDEPAPRALVRVVFGWQGISNLQWTTRTDAEGRYRIEGVPLGTWLLPRVKTDRRALSYFDPQDHQYEWDESVRDGMVEAGQAKVLDPVGRVFGRDLPARRIRGVEGTLTLVPPPGVELPEEVCVSRGWRWSMGWGGDSEEVRPDASGAIPFFFPEGRVSARVEAGNLYGSIPLRVIEGDGPAEAIRVALIPLPAMRARLVDEAGHPFHREGVKIAVRTGFGGGAGGRSVHTDARGEIDLAGHFVPTAAGYVDETRLLLMATVPGFLTPTNQFPNRELALTEVEAMVGKAMGGPVVIDIPLRRSFPVRFTVVDSKGEPVPGVRLHPRNPEKFAEDDWTSDGRGEVEVGLRVMPEPVKGGLGILARYPYEASHFDVGSCLIGEMRGRFGPEDFRMKVWRYRTVRVTVLARDGTILANRPVESHRRMYRTDGNGEFTIELLDYTTSVSVKAEGYLRGGCRTEGGRAVVRLRPARRITVRVVAPPEVKDKAITVWVGRLGTGSQWNSGMPGRDGRARTLDLECPVGVPAEVRAETGDRMHSGKVLVPDGADGVEVELLARRLESTRLLFLHPDGTPATDLVTIFRLYEDLEGKRENLTPDEDGIIALDLPPGPNRWSWEPRMAGHRLVGCAPGFTVPSPDPVEIVMEKADRIVLALDGQGKGIRIDPQAVKASVSGAEGKLEFDLDSFGFDAGLLYLTLTFRSGPATIRVEYGGKTYPYEHEKPGLEPVKIRLR